MWLRTWPMTPRMTAFSKDAEKTPEWRARVMVLMMMIEKEMRTPSRCDAAIDAVRDAYLFLDPPDFWATSKFKANEYHDFLRLFTYPTKSSRLDFSLRSSFIMVVKCFTGHIKWRSWKRQMHYCKSEKNTWVLRLKIYTGNICILFPKKDSNEVCGKAPNRLTISITIGRSRISE